jgi:hypothetical protein
MIRRKTALLIASGVFGAVAFIASPAGAEVTKVDIAGRAAVGASGYEKVFGTAHFAIDPKDPRNRVIVGLDKAAVNAQGKVEFSADFYLMRPTDVSRTNGVALVEVSNRGRKGLLSGFNRAPAGLDPSTDADLGDGFLMRQGYTLAWVGWQFDIKNDGRLMSIKAPVASNTSTIVRAEFTPNDRGVEMTIADLAAYPPADAAGADTTLTVRDEQYGLPQPVAPGKYQLRGNVVSLPDGFEPGRIYQVAYRTANPAVGGIGLAAFRDFAAWLKHGQQGGANARWAYAYGSSQSGRFLRTFLYYGFNADEKGRPVFEGVMAHIAGAARLSINEPSATPNALSMYSATGFPFADAATRDPVSGKEEGLLDNDRARQHQPKVFYTNTAVEYWGGGRSAALIHTTPDGKSDLKLPDNVRVYLLTGAQHSPASFPARVTTGQQAENPVEYWWTLRALLTAMDRWVRQGTPPPASQYPKLADGTLVAASQVAFPAIPGVASPRRLPAVRQGETPLPFLVPQVDEDGNERAGVRTPEISVPVATYTGWNFRNPSIGGSGLLVSLMGSTVPFAATKETRAPNDPRRSLAERYRSHEHYTGLAKSAAAALVASGYLLEEDVPKVMQRAEAEWANARQVAGSR